MTTKLVPSQHRWCYVCGRSETSMPMGEEHHIVKRSLGGIDGPTIPICLQCHNEAHQYDWRMSYEDGHLIVTDRNGDILTERWWDESFDQAAYIKGLDTVNVVLSEVLNGVRYLDADGMEQAVAIAKQLGDHSWCFQAEALFWAVRSMPYGTKAERIAAVRNRLGISRAVAYRLLQLREAIGDEPQITVPWDQRRVLAIAAHSGDPVATITTWNEWNEQAEAGERPKPTTRELERHVGGKAYVRCETDCPECGQRLVHERRS